MEELYKALIACAEAKDRSDGDPAAGSACERLRAGLVEHFGPKVRLLHALEVLERDPGSYTARESLRDALERVLMGRRVDDKLSALAAEVVKGHAVAVPPQSAVGRAEQKPVPGSGSVVHDPRLRPMPAPETLRMAQRRFIVLAIMMLVAVLAAVLLAIQRR